MQHTNKTPVDGMAHMSGKDCPCHPLAELIHGPRGAVVAMHWHHRAFALMEDIDGPGTTASVVWLDSRHRN